MKIERKRRREGERKKVEEKRRGKSLLETSI